MSPQEENDSLADLLSGVTLPPADPRQREAIFAQTRGVLKQRRLVHRGIRVAALTACYVIGVLSVLGWQSTFPRTELAGPAGGVIGNSSTTSAGQSTPSTDPRPERTFDETHDSIDRSKPTETLTTYEKLRRAGDRQLNERGNLQGAIGCYRRALDFASDDDLQIVLERDSWLLIPLKEDRLEARKHVRKKS